MAIRDPNHPGARSALAAEDHNIKERAVFLDGVNVGTLLHDGTETTFRYSAVARRDNLWISASMKDLDAQYSGTEKRLPPFFANLLPEGKRREDVSQSLHISPDDEFALYEVFGSEVIGNTRTVPQRGASLVAPGVDVVEDVAQSVSFSEILEMASDINSSQFDAHSLPGLQNKVSRVATLVKDAEVKRGRQASILPLVILKLEDPQRTNIVANEAFFMDVAETAGLKTARHAITTDSDGAKGLLVERFDRRVVNDDVVRIYVEDGCQLQGKHPRQKYSGSYEDVCAAVMAAVDDPVRAAEELFRTYIYSFGIANGDLHAKNISVWKNPDTNEIELTPAYDLLCTSVDNFTTMAFTPKGQTISAKRLNQLGEALGLKPEKIASITSDVSGAIKHSMDSIDRIGFDQNKAKVCRSSLRTRTAVLDQLVERALDQVTAAKSFDGRS